MLGLTFQNFLPNEAGSSTGGVTKGDSWYNNLLKTIIAVKQSDNQAKIAQAQAQSGVGYTTIDDNYNPTLQRTGQTQGEQAGQVVGGFAENAVAFVGRNWLIFALIGGGLVLYNMQPRRNGARVRRNGKSNLFLVG